MGWSWMRVFASITRARLRSLGFIEANEIDLVAIGTIAIKVIPGPINGNIAERLQPRIPGSILSVKLVGITPLIALDPNGDARLM